jgi:hypothetical protein
MTKDISKVIVYKMNDGENYIGICDEMDWNKKEIKLKEAFFFHEGDAGQDTFMLYQHAKKELNPQQFSLKIKDIRSAYLVA